MKPCVGLQEGWKEPEDGEVVDSRPREDRWWEEVPVRVGEGEMGKHWDSHSGDITESARDDKRKGWMDKVSWWHCVWYGWVQRWSPDWGLSRGGRWHVTVLPDLPEVPQLLAAELGLCLGHLIAKPGSPACCGRALLRPTAGTGCEMLWGCRVLHRCEPYFSKPPPAQPP